MFPPVGPEQCNLMCPKCQRQVKTSIEYRSTTRTHMLAALLCLLSCIPCACCLYCTSCARNVEHHCPSCKTFLGVYER